MKWSLDHWQRVIALIDAELESLPAACALVTELRRRGCRLAVASNSPTHYVDHVLKKIGLLDAFDAIVGRDQVQNGKPMPDPYLEAARLIGCAPQDCVAVEDSPLGPALRRQRRHALPGHHPGWRLPERPQPGLRLLHVTGRAVRGDRRGV